MYEKESWSQTQDGAVCGEEGSNHLDDSLTNLSWLYNMNFRSLRHTEAKAAKISATDATTDDETSFIDIPSPPEGTAEPVPERPYLSVIEGVPFLQTMPDFRRRPVKPPYSYAQLIFMAMSAQAQDKRKMLLSEIYSFIMDNFIYYRTADPTWQV